MINVSPKTVKYYNRIYKDTVFSSDIKKIYDLFYTKLELYHFSLKNDNFLNKEDFNKYRTLNLKFEEHIICDSEENIISKYFYVLIKAFISNAKRFDIIKTSDNHISFKLLISSMKCLNPSFNRGLFRKYLDEIKNSKFFIIGEDYIKLRSVKELLNGRTYSVYSERILLKSHNYNKSEFLKECVYFMKSKPLSTNLSDNIKVLSDVYVSSVLGICPQRVGVITKKHLKVYNVEISNGIKYYNNGDYSYSLNIQNNIYNSKVTGSRIIANIYFKTYINKNGKITKLNKLPRSDDNIKNSLFEKNKNVNLNEYSLVSTITKKLESDFISIKDNNELLRSLVNNNYTNLHRSVTLSLVNNNLKKVKNKVIKIMHLIEFSAHLKNKYECKINLDINKTTNIKAFKYLYGFYKNLDDKDDETILKYNMMKKVFLNQLNYVETKNE